MSELTIIRHSLNPTRNGGRLVKMIASRSQLSKRRWRGTAEDGRQFGFDLEEPLGHSDVFFVEGEKSYVLEQEAEPILRVSVSTISDASRIAWMLGNLHLPVDVQAGAIHVPDDPAVLHLLARENIPHSRLKCVFTPGATSPHHAHHHDH